MRMGSSPFVVLGHERNHGGQRLADQQTHYEELITELRTQLREAPGHPQQPRTGRHRKKTRASCQRCCVTGEGRGMARRSLWGVMNRGSKWQSDPVGDVPGVGRLKGFGNSQAGSEIEAAGGVRWPLGTVTRALGAASRYSGRSGSRGLNESR